MEADQQSRTSWITDGIVIGSITALAYLISFLYEAGFCHFYDIPLSFISLNLTTIFVAAGAIFITAVVVFGIANLLYLIGVFDFSTHLGVAISRTAVFTLALLAFILIYGKQWRGWIGMAVMVVFFSILDFIFPLFLQKDKRSYREKFNAQAEIEERNRSVGRLLNTRFGNIGVSVLLVIIYALSLAYAAGKAHAEQQEEFLILDQPPEVVVLRVYGDNLITAPLNRAAKEVEKKLVIYKLSDDSPMSLTLEEVGQLTVKPYVKPMTQPSGPYTVADSK